MNLSEFSITFWGVRGTRPVPDKSTLKYGGNTACIQVQAGSTMLILDAGTGICNLGKEMMQRTGKIEASLLISHFHWDHIRGFPFFEPAYVKGNLITVYGEGKLGLPLAELFKKQMQAPFFPIALEQMGSSIIFREIVAGEEFNIEEKITVKTIQTNHVLGNMAYRLEVAGRSLCYLGDHEPHPVIDKSLADFCQSCDLLIYDTTYTNEEYLGQEGQPSKVGWGHSTWQEAVKLASLACVGRLVFFHHSPNRTDEALDKMEQLAQVQFPECLVAREGMTLYL